MLKISAVYLIGKAEIPIHYTTWGQVEQALLQPTIHVIPTTVVCVLSQTMPYLEGFQRHKCHLYVLLCFDLLACAKTSVLCGNGRTKLQADFVTQSFSK